MQELRLVAVSEDGTYLVLATAGRGTRFTLPVDDRLRAAVRGNFSRLGQYEIEVESPLRPKEIQARIRAGETAEEIAATAGIPVERVRWFEGPVLQEREYMAQQAQRVSVRMPGETTPGPTLGELVAERLTRRGVPADEIDWDSAKRDDNLWRVRLGFVWNGHTRHAEWLFDPRRRHITPNDDEAMRLSAAEYVEPDTESATVRPFVPRLASKLAPVPPLPEETSPGRGEQGFGVPAVRSEPARPEPLRAEPAALAEHVPPPRLSPPLRAESGRPEPGRPEPYADEPSAYRPELTPVPFRLPQSLIATPDPAPAPTGPETGVDNPAQSAGDSAAPPAEVARIVPDVRDVRDVSDVSDRETAGGGAGRDAPGQQDTAGRQGESQTFAEATPAPVAGADAPSPSAGATGPAGASVEPGTPRPTTVNTDEAAAADAAPGATPATPPGDAADTQEAARPATPDPVTAEDSTATADAAAAPPTAATGPATADVRATGPGATDVATAGTDVPGAPGEAEHPPADAGKATGEATDTPVDKGTDEGTDKGTDEAGDSATDRAADATPPAVAVPESAPPPAPAPPSESAAEPTAEESAAPPAAVTAPASEPAQSEPAEPPAVSSAPITPAAPAAPAAQAPAQPAAEAPAAQRAPAAQAPAAAPASRAGDAGKRAGDGPKDGAKEAQKEGPKDTKPETPAPPVPKPAPPRPRKSRGRRASVPTWDEIMFGARKQD
ncbi:septation protein SepH [Microbispora sp. CA-135349]|uniref:septation protein SepH n=1 Tax=Microbispora sp. CA-135349 TaxID=3239953 RepID=UPI003D89DA32